MKKTRTLNSRSMFLNIVVSLILNICNSVIASGFFPWKFVYNCHNKGTNKKHVYLCGGHLEIPNGDIDYLIHYFIVLTFITLCTSRWKFSSNCCSKGVIKNICNGVAAILKFKMADLIKLKMLKLELQTKIIWG